jgi:hypothetical protein
MPSRFVGLRLDSEHETMLREIKAQTGETTSAVLQRALRALRQGWEPVKQSEATFPTGRQAVKQEIAVKPPEITRPVKQREVIVKQPSPETMTVGAAELSALNRTTASLPQPHHCPECSHALVEGQRHTCNFD